MPRKIYSTKEGYKICCSCDIEQPLNEFYRQASGMFGVTGTCSSCQKEYSRKYREKNREKIRESRKRHYYEEGGKEKSSERAKIWHKANSDKVKIQRKKHREKYKKISREWYEKNKGRVLNEAKERIKILDDNYIKSLIARRSSVLLCSDIPEEIVEIKRLEIQLRREIKDGNKRYK